MRQKLISSGVLGGLLGYAFTFHLLVVFSPFALPMMDTIGGKLVFLGFAMVACAIFAYLIVRKLDFSAIILYFPRLAYQKILAVVLLAVVAFAMTLGGNYFLHGWLFPPTSHDIELTYIDGYVKITQILLPGKESIELSTIEYSPEEAWEIDSQNVNAIRTYARLAFSTGNVDYVKFFFAANAEGLIYLNIDGQIQPVVVQADDARDYLQPLSFLGLPSRFGRWMILSVWGVDTLLFFGVLCLLFFVKGWMPFAHSVGLLYGARVTGVFVVMVLFFPYASYPWFSPADNCSNLESCHYLLLPNTVQPWWFVVGIVAALLVWELVDRYRRIGIPVVLTLGGVLAVVMLFMNFAQDLGRLPLSFDECLSNSADGCLFQYRQDHGLDGMYGRRTAIQVAGYLNEHFPGSKLVVPESMYAETFYRVGLQPGPVFEGKIETVSSAAALTAAEEAYLMDFAHTYYPRLQETDISDYPIYLIHPDGDAIDKPIFVARLGMRDHVFVYPEGLLP